MEVINPDSTSNYLSAGNTFTGVGNGEPYPAMKKDFKKSYKPRLSLITTPRILGARIGAKFGFFENISKRGPGDIGLVRRAMVYKQ